MSFWIDSDLPDGVGVVPEPEGKPSAHSQAWSNLGVVLLLIQYLLHLTCHIACRIIAPLILLDHATLTFPGQWLVLPPQSREWGKIITTVRLAFAGLCLVLSSSSR